MSLRSTLLVAFTLVTTLLSAQILNPVSWSSSSEALGNDEFLLTVTADLDPGWSLYSQHTGDDGPVPTTFYWTEGDHFSRIGDTEEKGKKKAGYDPLFDTEVIKFTAGPVVFTQRVKVADYGQPIAVAVEFMVCDDTQCLPPTEEPFEFTLEPAGPRTGANDPEPTPATAPADVAAATPAEPESPEDETASAEPLASASATQARDNSGLLDPVQWTVAAEQVDELTYDVVLTATLDAGWTLYTQDNSDESGLLPIVFSYDETGIALAGNTEREAGTYKRAYDAIWETEVGKIVAGPARWRQRLNVEPGTEQFSGVIEYMTCDDTQCLPPDFVEYTVALNPLRILLDGAETTAAASPATGAGEEPLASLTTIQSEPIGECSELTATSVGQGGGMWTIFGLGFLGGLLALLTPCVFPMIPLTVSFFTKSSGNRRAGIQKAFLYGFFIFLVYLLLSVPFHIIGGVDSNIFNEISTNVTLNVIFFLVFVFFAFSFFGYYELTLPESWTNRASAAEGVGGLLGIFFMALTLALVSFSCTGPILGSLLVGAMSGSGGAMQLTAGMGGFGLALALPFGLFAAFPSVMSALPKSGGWLNSVKVVLGFIELGLALKFLSNADLVDHWNFLKLELFLGLWIAIGIGLALYLFGKLRFPHDSPVQKLSPLRIGLGAATVAFVLYLASGFLPNERSGSYRPLGLLSGIAPPVCYNFFQPCDCPQGLDCFKDLEEGLAYAKENNKPVMLDFTGYACVNCRKMEEHVWPEPEVYPTLRDEYVLISLYVDDKAELPVEEQQTVPKPAGGTATLRREGQKWAYFQAANFNVNSQPYYVLMSPDGQVLNPPVGYTPDVEDYSAFLECGLSNFRRLSER
jgi:thiol:disulfide interchange protein DsbD